MGFQDLSLWRWRQFERVDFAFHPRLTVLTGANGAGKTTVLNLLNRHFGWNIGLVSTPLRRKDAVTYFADYWYGRGQDQEPDPSSGHHAIGRLTYRDGAVASITVPESPAPEYQADIRGQQRVAGLFIGSHRPVYLYQSVDAIPTRLDAREQLLNAYLNEMRQRYQVNARVPSPAHKIKEALISLAVFGEGNESVRPNPEALETFNGFQGILRTVLPRSLGFRRIVIESPDVILDTRSGQFSFDAVSGGVAAIIDQAWQLFMYSKTEDTFTAVIDEPENHLHPELQRELLPRFLRAFPQVQFVVATHNPFVVTSVPDSHVYVLRFGRDRRVRSELLDQVNKAATANDVLRDVLGLENVTPLWAEARLKSIVERYAHEPINATTIPALRTDLRQLGMEHLLPDALEVMAEAEDDPAK